MMALHGTMIGGAMSYEAGLQVMGTITPIVQAALVITVVALAMGALVASIARRHDERHPGLQA